MENTKIYYCVCAHTHITSVVLTVFKCVLVLYRMLLSLGNSHIIIVHVVICGIFCSRGLTVITEVRLNICYTPYAQTCRKVSISQNMATSIRRGPFPRIGRLLILSIHVHTWKTIGHIVVFAAVTRKQSIYGYCALG